MLRAFGVVVGFLWLASWATAEECAPKRCAPGLAWWAVPSESPREGGYYVGGGVGQWRGEPPCDHEGTWGWDYKGWLPRRIELWWNHGRREQGGLGAYRTVGSTLKNNSSP